MRRSVSLILIIFIIFSFVSCSREHDPYTLLNSFLSAYGADGVIYTPDAKEGDDGYITENFLKKMYVYEGSFPTDFSIFLASHSDYSSECAAFCCRDSEECERVEEMCWERIKIIGAKDRGFVVSSGNIVFYSAMSDKDRAQRVLEGVLN